MVFASAANRQHGRVGVSASCAFSLDGSFCQFECRIAGRRGPMARLDRLLSGMPSEDAIVAELRQSNAELRELVANLTIRIDEQAAGFPRSLLRFRPNGA